MNRDIEKYLFEWKERKERKPLLIYGARQVGKTYSVLSFGEKYFKKTLHFNFQGNSLLASIFAIDFNIDRIITALSAAAGEKINAEDALLFFDEIQACPAAVTSLKYFCENAPQYAVIGAGSLLGVAVNREQGLSFPVGKVELLTMYPMTFGEFLDAVGETVLKRRIEDCFKTDSRIEDVLHEKALTLYRTYLLTGGMPECVKEYIASGNMQRIRSIQFEILSDYSSDFGQYVSSAEALRNAAVYTSIPGQLARENKKFQYSSIGKNARSRDYYSSVDWLSKAGLALRCSKCSKGKLPLEFYKDQDAFKLYFSDTGLLCAKYMLSPEAVLSDFNVGGEAKGAITENYVAQSLTASGLTLYYWSNDGTAEVAFIIQAADRIIPVECKTGNTVRSKSLGIFMEMYGLEYAVRVSARNFGFENGIKSVPLYAAYLI